MESFRELGKRLSNWNRWGGEDERGTLNLVTPERLVAASKSVRSGAIFDLGIAIDSAGPTGFRPAPIHLMTQTGLDMGNGLAMADDFIVMHLQCATQWDALCHWSYDGQMYNGFPLSDLSVAGAAHLGIQNMAKGIVGRGVLLDVAGRAGQPWLDVDYAITPDDLEACEERQGVRLGAGDILCFRTGWRKKYLESAAGWMDAEPGLSLECSEWLHDREIAAVCSDNWGVEVMPSRDPAAMAPMHCVLLRDLGMPIGEIFDFEELTAACEADGAWDFWFSAPPLKVTGGVGSPLNPVVIK